MNKKYRIVASEYQVEQLEDKVNRLMKEGWNPLGGVAVIIRQINEKGDFVDKKGKKIPVYFQAMIYEVEVVS